MAITFVMAEGFDLGAEVVALLGVVVMPPVVGFAAYFFGEEFLLQVIDVRVDFSQFIFPFGKVSAPARGAQL